MGWKENIQKHNDYVDFVAKCLTGYYEIIKEEDRVQKEIVHYLKRKYNWEYPKDYEMKLVSKRKRRYHFRIVPYDIIENIEIKVDVNV